MKSIVIRRCPDLVFTRFRAVVFVHGCFWHGHACPLFKVRATRREFWQRKISGNIERDREAVSALRSDGWRVLTVWECALRGRKRLSLKSVLQKTNLFLTGKKKLIEIRGLLEISPVQRRTPNADNAYGAAGM